MKPPRRQDCRLLLRVCRLIRFTQPLRRSPRRPTHAIYYVKSCAAVVLITKPTQQLTHTLVAPFSHLAPNLIKWHAMTRSTPYNFKKKSILPMEDAFRFIICPETSVTGTLLLCSEFIIYFLSPEITTTGIWGVLFTEDNNDFGSIEAI